jgi:hypothetical protein
MTSTTLYLVPQEGTKSVLDTSATALLTAHNMAFGSALTLVLQPAFSNDLLVTLPEDQALAVLHATIFKNGWGMGAVNTAFTELSAISSFLLALYRDELRTVAHTLDSQSPSSAGYAALRKDFQQLLDSVMDTCCELDPDSGSFLLNMQQMLEDVAELSAQIDDDYTRLHTAIAEVKNAGTITALEAQQKSLQDQLAAVNGQISDGATSTISSDVAFGFAFVTPFTDGGVTPGATAGAVLSVVGEADAIKQFNEQVQALTDKQTELSDAIFNLASTIAQDQSDAMTLTLTAAQIGVFNTQIKTLLVNLGSVIEQLTDWKSDLALLSDLPAPPSPHFYTQQVTQGEAYWQAFAVQLARYSSILALSVTNPSRM